MPSLTSIALAVAVMIGTSNAAFATMTCSVKKTPDGFVVLREKPDKKSRGVMRLSPNDLVHAGEAEQANGPWLFTQVWIHDGVDVSHKSEAEIEGWVHEKLLVGCDD